WRKRYGKLDVADVRRLRELEAENTRLKKMVAERDLEIDVMKDIAKKSGELGGAGSTSGLCGRTRGLPAARLPAAVGGAIRARIRLTARATRRTGAPGHAGARASVLPLRLSAGPGVPRAPGFCH